MIGINQSLQTLGNCRYRTVTAALCPTSDQESKSLLNHALEITEIREFLSEINLLTVETEASATVLTYHQPGANLQSP